MLGSGVEKRTELQYSQRCSQPSLKKHWERKVLVQNLTSLNPKVRIYHETPDDT